MSERVDQVGFSASFYEERHPLLRWLGRRRVRQDIAFHRVGDSILITLSAPNPFRLELDVTPEAFVKLVNRLVAP